VFAPRRCSKHVEQYTGLSPLGWNGTWAMLPQPEHTASNIWRGPRGALS
jgi:hypothetical protein